MVTFSERLSLITSSKECPSVTASLFVLHITFYLLIYFFILFWKVSSVKVGTLAPTMSYS